MAGEYNFLQRAIRPGYWFGNDPTTQWGEQPVTEDGELDYSGTQNAIPIEGVATGENITLNNVNPNLNGNNRKRPFRNLFNKMGEGGFRNLGSAQYDEEGFIDDPDNPGTSIPNPNYDKYKRYGQDHENSGEIVDKGKGFFFGKEGGFGSKFGTGHGLLSGFFGGGETSGGLAQAGKDLMEQGAYQHGNFYGAGGGGY